MGIDPLFLQLFNLNIFSINLKPNLLFMDHFILISHKQLLSKQYELHNSKHSLQVNLELQKVITIRLF
jgi:hypothetical protein